MTMQKTASTITPTLIPTLMLTGFTMLSGLVLSSSIVSADNDSTVDEVNITVPVSCTLSSTGQNSHNAEINNGTYDSAIGETTIKAFCNDNEGFAIYAIGYTDNEDGKNVLTNATLGSTHDIVTGIAISGTDSNWAMKIGTITSPTPTYSIIIAGSNDDAEKEQGDPDYSTFQEVPDDYAKVAYRTSSTDIDTNAEGATITTTYQAYISPTQSAGTYTGQVKYTLVHPHNATKPQKPINYTEEITCPAGYICYSPATNNAMGTMNVADVGIYSGDNNSVVGYQSANSNAVTTLIAPNFKNQGYGFVGWNTAIDGTGTTYGPNEDITTPNLSESGLTLYAKWLPSAGSLQNWTGCTTMTIGQVTALTDTRDNDTYAVAKLADGNCWMIENLRLDSTAIINSSNTDSPSQGFELPPSSDIWSINDPEYAEQPLTNTNNTNLGGMNSSGVLLEETPGGGYYDDWEAVYYYEHGANGNTFSWYSYGNSYNWYAATASNNSSSPSDLNASGSICPLGWTLPTGGEDGQFNTLYLVIGGTEAEASKRWRSYPNNYLYSGDHSSSRDINRGVGALYWSLTATRFYSDTSAYALSYSNSSFSSYYSLGYEKNIGMSVRCLLKTN